MTPLVVLHGFTGGPCAWDAVVRRLPTPVVFAPALLGHDGTARTHGVTRFDDEVDRIAELIRALSRPVHLAGYSLGGRVASGIVARHPEVVERATLVSAHPGLSDEAARAARREQDEAWCRLLEQDGIEAFVRRWEALPLFATQTPELRRAQRRTRLRHDPRGLAASLRLLGLGSMPPYDPGDVPVQRLVGELDEKFRCLAPATLIAGAGHNPLLEQPERVARALTRGSGS